MTQPKDSSLRPLGVQTGLVGLWPRLLVRAKMAEQRFMVTLALLIGCLAGLGAVFFRFLIQVVQRLAWGDGAYRLDLVAALPAWRVIVLPALGGLIVGPIVYFLAREAKGHGVPEVMEAVALRSGAIRPRLVVIKTLASAVTIGTGGSVGREGPIVQIGSAIGSTLGRLLKVSGRRLRTLVGCGAAAGIAATFNAPIAGALFAVEIILSDFAVTQFSPIVISSVIATVVSRHFLGDVPAFVVPSYSLESPVELIAYALLGVAAAVVGVAFMRTLYKLEDVFEALPIPPWLVTPLGGLGVGAMGLAFPAVLGVGYEAIEQALLGELALKVALVLVAIKILATALTLGSGASGGIFAPSLFMGAMTGLALGSGVHQLLPAASGLPGAYAVVGMGAVVAATTRAPITAIIILFELTSDYELIVPLMISCILATLISSRLQRESIYTEKLVRRGVNLSQGQEISVLRSIRVGDVMRETLVRLARDEPLGRVMNQVVESAETHYYVVDQEQHLLGVINLPELRSLAQRRGDEASPAVAADLAQPIAGVTPEQTLETMMQIFGGKNREEFPVVDTDAKLVGVITRQHVMDAYNRELMKRDMVAGLASGIRGAPYDGIEIGTGHRMEEIDAPGELVGHSLGELDIRARYRVQVLLVRRPSAEGPDMLEVVPGPDTQLENGDRLLVLGRPADLARLRVL